MRWKRLFASTALVPIAFTAWYLRQEPVAPPAGSEQMLVPKSEEVLAVYENTFGCTLYYTPKESGFSQDGGFDMTPESRSGLEGQKYPRDFLRAVEKEGFGRLKEPFGGKAYVRYAGGKWTFAEQAVDQNQAPLVARESCAIGPRHGLVKHNATLSVRSKDMPEEFARLRWKVTDTGSGVGRRQLDLYWGEDDPLGPGPRLCRPKGGPDKLENATVAVLR
ncbi:MAG: hypothetical protein QOE70_6188 [Chthoniobacter sp.]|jgi:hypothetical protein|nr:hypothetical protein [Chthoniobacter sp.]